jgi:hypothetical protein
LGTALMVGLAAMPTSLAAQYITTFVGFYVPTIGFYERENLIAPGDKYTWKHKSNFVLGGRIGSPVSRKVGFEIAIGYSPAKAELTYSDPSGAETVTEESAGLILGSARVLMKVGPQASKVAIQLMAGVGVVSHVGNVYDEFYITQGTTDIGGLLGIATRFAVAPTIAIRLDLENHLFFSKFWDAVGGASETKPQSDLVLSLGLEMIP